ncbi:MAG TPA: hypothetical protein VFF06_21175 [Polyangia bacterium]|nr:hypothetical protein [Polyangia bacterium]
MRIAWLALLVAACSTAPNTQRLPIGTRCGGDGDCGTQPFTCALAGYPGGYCTRPCSTDGDCPLDSACIAPTCRRKCADASGCRSGEGYACLAESGSLVCDPASGPPDAGAPSG